MVTNLIAKKSKPFTDGEFIKQCMDSMANTTYPHKKEEFFWNQFVSQTIARQTEKVGNLLKETWKVKLLISNFLLW